MRFLNIFILLLSISLSTKAIGVGGSGMFQYSVQLAGYISNETGKEPVAYLWIPDGCKKIKAVMFSQQNMTEETIMKNPLFQKRMKDLDVAMIWVCPAFSNNWAPAAKTKDYSNLSAQSIFEAMMIGLSDQSGHTELEKVPIIPFGHSAQATFPWNFAVFNNDCTLCIISFHGDAPRTNLCGYGTDNIEWGRRRNIDGIPGLMVEGEYEWWEARVTPALAFRMMYPNSCISFLCDTGRSHFDCGDETAEYIALFIKKAMQQRLQSDGTLKPVNPRDGYLFSRFHSDMIGTDGADKGKMPKDMGPYNKPTPFDEQLDPTNCFWYFDKEMADITYKRYIDTKGKKRQYVSVMQNGKLVPFKTGSNGCLAVDWQPDADGITFHVTPTYCDSTLTSITAPHGKGRLSIECVNGPVKKINDTTFRVYPYEAGWDNPRRSLTIFLAVIAESDKEYKGTATPFVIKLPADIIEKVNK